jgi:photosynthetic reaction center cytochrome c subunit
MIARTGFSLGKRAGLGLAKCLRGEQAMDRQSASEVLLGTTFTMVFVFAAAAVNAQSARPPEPASGSRTTEEAYKNIQVLKGRPADQLIPAMQFIANSLGVECDYCHTPGAFEKDDKKPKQIARKMIQMMTAINQENFDNHREVTCNSCHRGVPKPVAIPVIGEGPKPPVAEAANDPQNSVKLPSPDRVVDNYIRALGGASAIQKVTSQVAQGSANIGGRQTPIDIFARNPDKRVLLMHSGNGDVVTAYNGQEGWLAAPGRPSRDMNSSEIEAAKLDADLHFAIDMKGMFAELHVDHEEKVGEQSTYVVSADRPGQPPVKFYFDQQSGLLVRELRYAESPLGLNPTEIDYADFRDVDGVKTPFRWTVARPNGRFTIQLERVKQNVPIDDLKFARPRMPAMATSPDSKP